MSEIPKMKKKVKKIRKIQGNRFFLKDIFLAKKKKSIVDLPDFGDLEKIFWQKKKKEYQGGKNAYLRRGNISG